MDSSAEKRRERRLFDDKVNLDKQGRRIKAAMVSQHTEQEERGKRGGTFQSDRGGTFVSDMIR